MPEKKFIDFEKTGILSPLILDYLSGSPELNSFYKYSPSLESFASAIAGRKEAKTNRKLLANVLLKQYKTVFENNFSGNEIVKSNIEKLRSDSCFTVTTGHQLNIFTGPLYFLYKIISTINLSEKLKEAYPGNHFIPVYWMASEDHDFEEINHIHLFGKKIIWQGNERGACGRMNTQSLKSAIDELKIICGEGDSAKEIISLFEKAYIGSNNLAEATRSVVHALFAKFGLVIVDGDNKELKKEFAVSMKDDLLKHTAYKLVSETNKLLEANYKVQVHPREINLFYLGNASRERIEAENGTFKILNTELKYSTEQVMDILGKNPESFSPNVVLRPLYQEKILPNLAYVGGGGELSYWLQYRSFFEAYKVTFPVLMLRNSVLWIDKAATAKMKKLKLSSTDLFLSEQELVKKIILENENGSILLSDEINEISLIFEKIKEKAISTDQSLTGTVESEKQKVTQQVKYLEEKLLRAEKKKHESAVSQVKKMKEKFFPGGSFQERYDNFIPFYLAHGNAFLEELKKDLNPFNKQLLVIAEQPE